MSKRIAWLDTVRVFSALMVIVGHYFSCFMTEGPDNLNGLALFFFHAGAVGVFLFFILSGYLIPASLERAGSLWSFYKRKLIRVVIPFTVAYIVLGLALIIFSWIQPAGAEYSPFYRALYQGGVSKRALVSMFPVDVSLLRFFGLSPEWFVGEWFMGVLIELYLIAPLLCKLVKCAPLVTFAASVLISIGTFHIGDVMSTHMLGGGYRNLVALHC